MPRLELLRLAKQMSAGSGLSAAIRTLRLGKKSLSLLVPSLPKQFHCRGAMFGVMVVRVGEYLEVSCHELAEEFNPICEVFASVKRWPYPKLSFAFRFPCGRLATARVESTVFIREVRRDSKRCMGIDGQGAHELIVSSKIVCLRSLAQGLLAVQPR